MLHPQHILTVLGENRIGVAGAWLIVMWFFMTLTMVQNFIWYDFAKFAT